MNNKSELALVVYNYFILNNKSIVLHTKVAHT